MTYAQLKAKCKEITEEALYRERKFRKKCVTQDIVKFIRCYNFYELQYRGKHIFYLFGNSVEEKIKLRAVWDIIKIAEETIEKIEGVINDKCTMESQMCTVI